ncbi:hypothetical protein MUN86_26800 (plasmid) [Hymenobacter volaticus]|uniref:Uncharacterized protein n=1 Tax=Hymenobacter volaticus TaxID=2932254 RepID=A0ABY4GES5_9BACT|nr:hypothetical protein [Hymenobacter volaticus]UOQ69311.1 hypothetical protein MUN86_26800 [Hymenobacter volaticus]
MSHSLPAVVLEGMRVNGRPIALDRLGRGKVSFPVPRSATGKADSVTAHWTGTIRALIGTRSDSFTIRVPYTIVNPLNRSDK